MELGCTAAPSVTPPRCASCLRAPATSGAELREVVKIIPISLKLGYPAPLIASFCVDGLSKVVGAIRRGEGPVSGKLCPTASRDGRVVRRSWWRGGARVVGDAGRTWKDGLRHTQTRRFRR